MFKMKFWSNFNVIFLGFYFVPWSFICSETLPKEYTSYRRYPYCTPSEYMKYPTTAEEVVSIVQDAINRGVKVKPIGQRHSQTDIICTGGIPVDMRNLRFFKMNADNATATFGPGVTVREAGEFLRLHRRALRTTPAFGNITLGGAIGTGAHGSTIKYNSTISAQVVALKVVDGFGKLQVISELEDLQSFRLNLGLLGIVVEITLYTVPLYKVLARNYVVTDDILTNDDTINLVKNADQISFHWFPIFKEVVVVNTTFVDANEPGEAWTYELVPTTYESFNVAATTAKEIAFNLTSNECSAASAVGYDILHVLEYMDELSLWAQTPGLAPIYTEDGEFLQNPAVGYPELMLAAVCSDISTGLNKSACAFSHGDVNAIITVVDNEFGIPLSNLKDFIVAVKDIISKTPASFPLLGIAFQFTNTSDAYMSMSYGRVTAHVEFFLWKRTDPYNDPSGSLAAYQTITQTLAKRFNGRSHWGKSGLVYHSREMLKLKLDPTARRNFVDAMKKFDPNGIFMNNFGQRVIENGTAIDIDPLTTRCALLDNCFCSTDSDCGKTQTCTYISGYNYPVCKTKNELPEQSFDQSIIPPPIGVLNWLLNVVPNLANAVLVQCSLTSVLEPILG